MYHNFRSSHQTSTSQSMCWHEELQEDTPARDSASFLASRVGIISSLALLKTILEQPGLPQPSIHCSDYNESLTRGPVHPLTRLPRIQDFTSVERACDLCTIQSKRRLPCCRTRRWNGGDLRRRDQWSGSKAQGTHAAGSIAELVARRQISAHR